MSDNTIHEVVRNRYSAIAVGQVGSCCSTASGDCGCDCGSTSSLYEMSMLENLPVDVTSLSLGCEGTQFTRSNALCCAA